MAEVCSLWADGWISKLHHLPRSWTTVTLPRLRAVVPKAPFHGSRKLHLPDVMCWSRCVFSDSFLATFCFSVIFVRLSESNPWISTRESVVCFVCDSGSRLVMVASCISDIARPRTIYESKKILISWRQRRKQGRKQWELVFFHLVFLAKKPSQNCPMADDANDELSGLDVEVPDETITAPLV